MYHLIYFKNHVNSSYKVEICIPITDLEWIDL
jgi:hypothetical protein